MRVRATPAVGGGRGALRIVASSNKGPETRLNSTVLPRKSCVPCCVQFTTSKAAAEQSSVHLSTNEGIVWPEPIRLFLLQCWRSQALRLRMRHCVPRPSTSPPLACPRHW